MAENQFLKLISGEDHLLLNALAGKKTILKSKEIFYHVDPVFNKYSFKPGVHTAKRTIEVYETIPGTRATLMETFASLSGDWNKKWLSQSQISKVCKHFKKWLRTENYSTFILCNMNEFSPVNEETPWRDLVVVCITVDDDEISIHTIELDNPAKRDGIFQNRLIVPKRRKSKD